MLFVAAKAQVCTLKTPVTLSFQVFPVFFLKPLRSPMVIQHSAASSRSHPNVLFLLWFLPLRTLS